MRRVGYLYAVVVVCVAAVVVTFAVVRSPPPRGAAPTTTLAQQSSVSATPGPVYPTRLVMQRGLFSEIPSIRPLAWGSTIPSSQDRWVTLKSDSGRVEWGQWSKDGLPGPIPVRSTDGGATWQAAGPPVANDWAGGGEYYLTRIFALSATAVVMVSNAVVDVSTDGGHTWFQYGNGGGGGWVFDCYLLGGGGIGLRVTSVPGAVTLRTSYATYRLSVSLHEWIRTAYSAG